MKKANLAFGPGVVVRSVVFQENQWFVSADGGGERSCPTCGRASASRHSWHVRCLQDLPIQGAPVVLALRLGRWRCLNEACARKTFVERLKTAFPFARKTQRVIELVRLFGHAAGGRTSEKLLARLALPVSDNAILRQLKRHASERRGDVPLRVIAIDDWSWRKGFSYGTIIVDLERRIVADVLETRSAKETADWVKQHPEIEVVSRDRCGLYAQGVRQASSTCRPCDAIYSKCAVNVMQPSPERRSRTKHSSPLCEAIDSRWMKDCDGDNGGDWRLGRESKESAADVAQI
jgi:zinc-finger of transposase IS204/IS1001/IS1096/IS1165/Transposase